MFSRASMSIQRPAGVYSLAGTVLVLSLLQFGGKMQSPPSLSEWGMHVPRPEPAPATSCNLLSLWTTCGLLVRPPLPLFTLHLLNFSWFLTPCGGVYAWLGGGELVSKLSHGNWNCFYSVDAEWNVSKKDVQMPWLNFQTYWLIVWFTGRHDSSVGRAGLAPKV